MQLFAARLHSLKRCFFNSVHAEYAHSNMFLIVFKATIWMCNICLFFDLDFTAAWNDHNFSKYWMPRRRYLIDL